MEIIIALVFIFLIVKLLFPSDNSGRRNNSRRNSYSNWNSDDTYCDRDSESSSSFDWGSFFGDGDSHSSYDSDECDSYDSDSDDDSSEDCSDFSDDESDECDSGDDE